MTDIISERVAAELDGDFVVFRLGMRINTLWKVHEWLPILRASVGMHGELEDDPESGLLAYDTKFGLRNIESVQYWQSFEALRSYALDPDSSHAPAIRWTNEQMRRSDAVAIWHETYLVREGEYEAVYDNAPPTGLGNAGDLVPAKEQRATAAGRLGLTDGDDLEVTEEGVQSERFEFPQE